jgi:CheY-like chemotaxis protein
VSIRVLCEDRPDGPATGAVKIRFEVEDTGIGIPVSLHPKLFEVFTQADNSATRKYGGTGLGLSISKRLVELMGGEIGFHSQEGVGSIFWFTLDLQDAEKSLTPVSDPSTSRTILSEGDIRLALVVEDNEINQRLMTRMLETVGLRVVAVASGADAIVAVRRQKFDLVFMDCQMPGMDGYEATEEIRRYEAEAAKSPVPIIAVTASVIKGDRERCLAVGMNDYLAKPIDPDLLISRINHWLKKSLDLRALERIRQMNIEGEADFLEELVKIFRDTSPERIERMRSAIENRDGRALAREAHYLKSSSANLGAMQLSSICQKLDEMGRSESFEGATETLNDLRDLYPGVCSALQHEVHSFQT